MDISYNTNQLSEDIATKVDRQFYPWSYVSNDVPRGWVFEGFTDNVMEEAKRYLKLLYEVAFLCTGNNALADTLSSPGYQKFQVKSVNTQDVYNTLMPDLMMAVNGNAREKIAIVNCKTLTLTQMMIAQVDAERQRTSEFVPPYTIQQMLIDADRLVIYSITDTTSGDISIVAVRYNVPGDTMKAISLCTQAYLTAVHRHSALFIENQELHSCLAPENLMTVNDDNRIKMEDFIEGRLAELIKERIDKLDEVIAKAKEEEARLKLERETQLINDSILKSQAEIMRIKIPDTRLKIMKDIASRISSEQSRIDDYDRELQDCKRRLEALQTEYNSYRFREAMGLDTEILKAITQFVGVDKPIKQVERQSENMLYLHCATPILYWEDDEMVNWKNQPDALPVLKAVTSRKYQLMTTCTISLDLADKRVGGFAISMNPELMDALHIGTYQGHPHIARYSCFGNNQDTIVSLLRNNQLDMVFATINNCICQLNLSDGCVCTSLAGAITGRASKKCFMNIETSELVCWNEIRAEFEGNNEEATSEVY